MVNVLNTVAPEWDGFPVQLVEHGNGNASHYVEVNGTHYKADTPKAVVSALEDARHSGTRLFIEYGQTDPNDTESETPLGKAWGTGGIATGTIGRSLGPIRIPLEIKTRASDGGGSILDDCIVRITRANGYEVYRHPQYQPADEVIYFTTVANWKSIAERLAPMPVAKVHVDYHTRKESELRADDRPVRQHRLPAVIERAEARGVKSCEVWFGGDEREEVEAAARDLGIELKVRRPRF